MANINELRDLFIQYKIEYTSIDSCIKWAEERLIKNEEEDDQDIIQLAGTTKREDAEKLVVKILGQSLKNNAIEYRFYYGKYLVKIYDRFKSDKLTIDQVGEIITDIAIKFDYSFEIGRLYNYWDFIWMNGKEPFEKEFEYIAELWRTSNSLEEYNQLYDKKISQSHVVRMKARPIFYYNKYNYVIWFIIIIAITLGITLIKEFFYR